MYVAYGHAEGMLCAMTSGTTGDLERWASGGTAAEPCPCVGGFDSSDREEAFTVVAAFAKRAGGLCSPSVNARLSGCFEEPEKQVDAKNRSIGLLWEGMNARRVREHEIDSRSLIGRAQNHPGDTSVDADLHCACRLAGNAQFGLNAFNIG